jgi:pimeloyl-ACP methyl ester carboxylesterase
MLTGTLGSIWEDSMTTFVLVHGAWHGGWCWNRVSHSLHVTGSNVYTPTLTGLGERAHLASRETDLETHIADVLGVLEMEDLKDIVLVGHSYGGIVVTAVADRAAGRIAQLVYLDGVVPHDGQCLFSCISPQAKAFFEEKAGDSWCIPVAAASVQFLGLKREEDVRWVMPKLKPHPIRTFRDAVRLTSKSPPLTRTYINCIGDKPLGQPRSKQAEGIVGYHELQTGHDAMVAAPQDVAELLRNIANVGREHA